jgi:peptide/nickel transport system permease protein
MLMEVFPSIRSPLLVDFGLRLTAAILLVAALSFVGLGLQPPAADWGLMIGENRIALTVQPWPVVVPAAAIAALTIGINLVIDGTGRRTRLSRIRPRV